MKNTFTLILFVFSIASFGQKLTFNDWQNEAKENKRLLPKYGELNKSEQEIKADKEFEKEVMKSFSTKTEASSHMIDLGFQYLSKGDIRTAMYRFNQAYLLDNGNSNIYWGFGAIYMAFRRMDLAREQYEEGLRMDNKNDKILIDYGTTYLGEFYNDQQTDVARANESLDKAIQILSTAYEIKPENANSSYKLSICYLYKNDCLKANEYLKISEKLGNPNITDDFKTELEERCRQKDLDCSKLKVGKFKSNEEGIGETTIERTETFQIEENKKHGIKIKLKVTWIDDCKYQLQPVEDLANPGNKNLPAMIVTCTIVEITENGYVQIASNDVNSSLVKTELIRVK